MALLHYFNPAKSTSNVGIVTVWLALLQKMLILRPGDSWPNQ